MRTHLLPFTVACLVANAVSAQPAGNGETASSSVPSSSFSSAIPPSSNPWLTAKLYGHDNEAAALRPVIIEPTDTGFIVTIKNQFNFQCDLSFDSANNPEYLSNCRSLDESEPTAWKVKEPKVRLKCSENKLEYICQGSYTLVGEYSSDKAVIKLARRR